MLFLTLITNVIRCIIRYQVNCFGQQDTYSYKLIDAYSSLTLYIVHRRFMRVVATTQEKLEAPFAFCDYIVHRR